MFNVHEVWGLFAGLIYVALIMGGPMFMLFKVAEERGYKEIADEPFIAIDVYIGILLTAIFFLPVLTLILGIALSETKIGRKINGPGFLIVSIVLLIITTVSAFYFESKGLSNGEQKRIKKECIRRTTTIDGQVINKYPSKLCKEKCRYHGVVGYDSSLFESRYKKYDERWCKSMPLDYAREVCLNPNSDELDRAIYCCSTCSNDETFTDEDRYCLDGIPSPSHCGNPITKRNKLVYS